MAPEAVTEACARTTQATRKGWPYSRRSRRPPARDGPCILSKEREAGYTL